MESPTGITTVESVSDQRSDELSEAVVTAVAKAKDVDPLELEPLYSVVDPDALDSLFRPAVGSRPTSLTLTFTMAGCEVVVRDDGEIAVTPHATKSESRAAIPSDD